MKKISLQKMLRAVMVPLTVRWKNLLKKVNQRAKAVLVKVARQAKEVPAVQKRVRKAAVQVSQSESLVKNI